MKDIKLKVLLDEWYIAMRDRQEEKAIKLKEKVENLYSEENSTEYEKLFQLMQIRYYLMIKDYQSVFNWFHVLGSERDIPEELKLYYHLFNGILMFDNGKYQDALSSFLQAETILKYSINPRETAECKYWLSYTYFRLSDNSKSIKAALKGLELFQKEQNELGTAFCENLLGLNSTVLRQFRDAESHYHFVRRYAEKHDHQKFKCIIYLNLGDLYSDLEHPNTAIEYLKKANEYTWKEDYIHPLRIFYLLTKQYFIVKNVDHAFLILNKGLELAKNHNNEEFKHLFKILKAMYLPNTTDVEQIYKDGIEFFKTKQLWRKVWKLSEDFAEYFQKQNRFQESVKYYDLAVQARKIIEKKGAEVG